MFSLAGLIVSLVLLIYLTIRGAHLLVAAPAAALLVALTGGLALLPEAAQENSFVDLYMRGFSGFIASWFFMFLLGSVFGKLMEESGAAAAIAHWLLRRLGKRSAALGVVVACAVMTYGGVSVFVVAFSAYPLALGLFREANLPRRFIPAAIAFGSVTFTMTSAGSPEIQNWIPIEFLGTSPYAGWQVSIVIALMMALGGYWLLQRMLHAAATRGEHFEARHDDPQISQQALPAPILAMIPLVAVLTISFLTHEVLGRSALIVALGSGCLACLLLNWRSFFSRASDRLQSALGGGAAGALIAIGNTAAVVGFGSVAQASPAFADIVAIITSLPGDPLISAAVAVTSIAAVTGSASGGQAIALPVLAPHYLEAGVAPDELHRVVAIASGALDSLPHNGYVVTTIRAICGETHRAAYGPVAMLTVLIPVLGTIVAIALFMAF